MTVSITINYNNSNDSLIVTCSESSFNELKRDISQINAGNIDQLVVKDDNGSEKCYSNIKSVTYSTL